MSEDRSAQIVVGCLAASAAIVASNSIAEGRPPEFRQLAGFTFAAVGLGTLAIFAPDLAGAMSMLVLTSAVFIYGEPTLNAITGLTSAAPIASTTAPRTPSTITV